MVLLSFLILPIGCIGVVIDSLKPDFDNLKVSEDFTPDPNFGDGQPRVILAKPHTAKDIGRIHGVVWLEMVVGPKSKMSADASGFMVEFAGRPHILSAGHICRGLEYKAIYAYFSEGQKRPEEVEIVAADETLDLALLRFKNPDFKYTNYPPLGRSAMLEKGDRVFPFGNPFGYEFLVREGVVCKTDYGLNYPEISQPQMIMHDATINPGDSGGPLFNELGEIIGMNVMGIHPGTRRDITTIYGAIPIDDIRTVLRRMQKSGYAEHAFAGWKFLDTNSLNPLNYADLDMPEPKRSGLMIYIVESGSPAEKAGLKVGDILLEYDGKKPTTYNELARYIMFKCSSGNQVKLRIYRETHWIADRIFRNQAGNLEMAHDQKEKFEELEITVTLEKR